MRVILRVVLLVWLAGCIHQGSRINKPPVAMGSGEPSLTVTDKGLLLSWLEPFDGDILLRMAVHNGIRWSEPKTIAKGYDWFVNWADFPAIVANGDKLFTHFLKKSAQPTFAYDVMFSISSDMGTTWSIPKKLHQDTVAAEHGFVSAIPYKEGFYVSWLDGRYTVEDNGTMTIRGAYVDIEGNTQNPKEIDQSTCDCCQTSMTMVNGVPWTFYRDRTQEEIRDIYFTKLIDERWTEPDLLHNDNWVIKACPVNGPVASAYAGNMAVAWVTGAQGEYKVKLKISTDAGNNFSDEILVDGPNALGRVDVQIDSARIYISYLTKRGDKASIMLKIYGYSGNLQDIEIMVNVSPERGTGFPRTALWRDNLIFTWTDVEENSVRILRYPLNGEYFGPQSALYKRK